MNKKFDEYLTKASEQAKEAAKLLKELGYFDKNTSDKKNATY